ncbi:MAG: hypothetical protein H0V18_00665 [Pyrinomonadaceae bacterium]|nr:hypothetical protein [Pyrinomonadaceae bacterium]
MKQRKNLRKPKKKSSRGDDATRLAFQSKIDWKNSRGESISYNDVIWRTIVRSMSKTPSERLNNLTDILDKEGSKTEKALARQLRAMAAKIDRMDFDWGAFGVTVMMTDSVNLYIERMLPRYLSAMIHQLTVEGLLTSTGSPLRYQEDIRTAAGLKTKLSVDTEEFITQVHSHLIDTPRKRRDQVKPGGSDSPLKQYSSALCFHYEWLCPLWTDAKKLFKKNGGCQKGREAVRYKYRHLGRFARWAKKKPNYIGLPDELLNKLSANRGAEYSRPKYLAYEHAAYLCGFGVGEDRAKRNKTVYSVKQISRVIGDHREELGVEYYDSLFRNPSILGTVIS